jgi:hypothetical protein
MTMESIRLLAAASLIALAGCGDGVPGPALAPVSGILTLDAKPIEGATVVFTPKGDGTMSMATTDPAGKFVMKTGSGRNGAVVGDHSISVTLTMTTGGSKATTETSDGLAPPLANELQTGSAAKAAVPPRTVFLVPEKYGSPSSSGLSVTVPSGGLSDYKLELKK